jgi:2'-5' RNA ligase
MDIRLAVIPPAVTSKIVGKLGTQYGRKFRHRFLVDNQKLLPHATLFKVDIPRTDYKKLLLIAEKVIRQIPAFDVRVNKFGFPPEGWLDLQLATSLKLIALRKRLLKEIKRSGLGIVTVKTAYRPHITLTRFYNNNHNRMAVKGEPKPQFMVPVTTIGLCLSRQTQVYKILNTIKIICSMRSS